MSVVHPARAGWKPIRYDLPPPRYYIYMRLFKLRYEGRFAVKKIAVGQSQDYLVNALREVSTCVKRKNATRS